MKDILVAFDGSEGSHDAVDWGLRLGQLTGRTVRILTVRSLPALVSPALGAGYMYDPMLDAVNAKAAAKTMLDDEVIRGLSHLFSRDPVTVRVEVREGLAAEEIVDAATGSSLVVMGTRGRGRLGNVLGSCLSHVVHHTPCPVMVVPHGATPDVPVSRVVVGIDGSVRSRSALLWAHELARVEHADLVAVHAVERLERPMRVEDRLAWRREVILALPPDSDVPCDVTVSPGPAHEVLTCLAEPGDLLVVGSHGTSAIAGVLLGSVSTACLAHPDVPVVVVKDHEEGLAHLFGPMREPIAEVG
jgi:nucleotide-binding universal stress UspA family protein